MVVLKLVDESCFEEVIGLEVEVSDKNFVASNLRSLAEAWLYRENEDVFPYAILTSEHVVGFALLEKDKEEQHFLVWRLMIDKKFQGQGFGKSALKSIIKMASDEAVYPYVQVDYVKENHRMERLLKSLGFEQIGSDSRENFTRLSI